MPVATSPNPIDTENGPTASPRAGRPRKPKRLDSDGKPMHRLVMIVSDAGHRKILEAISDHTGSRFVKDYVFGSGNKEEFLGAALTDLCESWLNSDDDGNE